jgi:hypothetical protein
VAGSTSIEGKAVELILLASDRPTPLLERPIREFCQSASHDCQLGITVIDDSEPQAQAAHREILATWSSPACPVRHLNSAARQTVIERLRASLGQEGTEQLVGRRGGRDISANRNLGLAVALALQPDLAILSDDDVLVVGPELNRLGADLHRCESHAVVGCRVWGIADESSLFRIRRTVSSGSFQFLGSWINGNALEEESPLLVPSGTLRERSEGPVYVSSGFAGFAPRLPLLPFPAGYNEDWNWCLLRYGLHGLPSYRSASAVQHAPTHVHFPDEALMLWELEGEILHASLLAALRSIVGPTSLEDLASRVVSNPRSQHVKSALAQTTADLTTRAAQQQRQTADLLELVAAVETAVEKTDWPTRISAWFADYRCRMEAFAGLGSGQLQADVARALCDVTL